MKNKLSIIAIISFMLITAGDALAGSSTALMNIRTWVLPIAKHTIVHQKNNLIITQADIERGYVDARRAMILSIKTNSTNGYLLGFSVVSGFFRELRVLDGNNTYTVSRLGGEVHIPYEGMNYITKELSFRFYLFENAKPGTYRWPVALMISAI